MKHNLYSIFDTATGLYSRPHAGQADAAAIRDFGSIVQDAEHPIAKHPGDYSLIRLGIFDDTTGKLSNEENTTLQTGLEAVAASRQIEVPDNINEPDYQAALKNYGGTK